MSHTSQGEFPAEQLYLKLAIKSHVKRINVLGYQDEKLIPEEHKTQHLGLYKTEQQK